MDQPTRSPLVRSFERHLRALNRSERTIETYLISLRQADAFLRARGTTLEAATRADLEAFMADVLARGRAPSTAATYHKVLKLLYAWLVEEEELATDPTAKLRPRSCPTSRSRSFLRMRSSACSRSVPAAASRRAATPRC